MCSRHSHQLPPRFCGRQWRVMRATEGERFLFLSCLWRLGCRFEFNVWWRRSMERGHMAYADWGYWWHDLWVSRYFSVSLGFWFKKLFFFLHFGFSFFSCSECLSLLLVSAFILILLLRLWPCSGDEFLRPRLFRFSRYATSSIFLKFFLHGPLINSWIFLCLLLLLFLCLICGHLGLGIPFHG